MLGFQVPTNHKHNNNKLGGMEFDSSDYINVHINLDQRQTIKDLVELLCMLIFGTWTSGFFCWLFFFHLLLLLFNLLYASHHMQLTG
jgi:hypothetical protein